MNNQESQGSINGVIYTHREDGHEDDRRTLSTVFNGDLGDFVARQVKLANMKIDAVLGGHFHHYAEAFAFAQGGGVFALKDPSQELIEKYEMEKGATLFIPKGIAHAAQIRAGSILIGCTEEPYVSAKQNDHIHEFEHGFKV